MKGIILAGGKATRLRPLTLVTNKHLLPVYNKPMIYYPINTLVKAGIKDIMIVSGKSHAGQFMELLKSGKDFGVRFSFGIQEEAAGIADALSLCKDFSDDKKIIVILGDNVFEDDLSVAANDFAKQEKGAKVFLKKVENPKSFGVAEIEGDKIKNIIEKPEVPVSNLAVAGVYMYDNQVWDVIEHISPSARGELEITDVNNFYIEQGTMNYEILKGWWGDCGENHDSLLKVSNLVAKKEIDCD